MYLPFTGSIPNEHKSTRVGWGYMKLAVRNNFLVSQMGAGAQELGPFFAASPGNKHGAGSGAAWTRTDAHIG